MSRKLYLQIIAIIILFLGAYLLYAKSNLLWPFANKAGLNSAQLAEKTRDWSEYKSSYNNYTIKYPKDFAVTEVNPSLVVFSAKKGSIRVNVGCSIHGTDGLTTERQKIKLQEFKADEITYKGPDGTVSEVNIEFEKDKTCYALEMFPGPDAPLETLRTIAETFNFTK